MSQKEKCDHLHRKNIDSFKFIGTSNIVDVVCLDCGAQRSEVRHKTGAVETGKWFKLRLIKI